ncbi:MAG: ABC transporter permease subunit [Dehalococcoidia bacterium]|tara:strand:- start:832 stop:1650 length:819 start_codon:yes stop_codon:yes gene_type:complete
MLIKLVKYDLIRESRSLLFWSLGISFITFLLCAFYPTIKEQGALMDEYMASFPPEMIAFMGDPGAGLASASGYLSLELFGIMAPAIFVVYGCRLAVGSIAGEEYSRTIELMLSLPIKRDIFVVARFIGIAMNLLLLTLSFVVTLIISAALFDMDISPFILFQNGLNVWVLAMSLASLTFFVSAAWGTRGVAYTVGFGVFLVGYLISSLAGFVEWLGQVKYLSFVYYYNGYYADADWNSLVDGILLTPWLIMCSSIVIFLVLAILMLPRRDIH